MKSWRGFTLIELLVVVAIIGILAALVLQVAGYVQRKGATSRAQAEIAALGAALESYKVDNGGYPGNAPENNAAKRLDPSSDFNPNPPSAQEQKYKNASGLLAVYLSGSAVSDDAEVRKFKIYFEPNNSILSKESVEVDILGTNGVVRVRTKYFMDPFGSSYGYSTKGVMNGPNYPDIWSTSGNNDGSEKSLNQWIKNW